MGSRFLWLAAATGALLLSAVIFFIDANSWLHEPMPIRESQVFDVPPGASLQSISNELDTRGLVDRPRYLVGWGRWLGFADRIQVGEYELSPGMTPETLLDHLVSGHVIQYTFRIREGDTVAQLLAELRTDSRITHELSAETPGDVVAELNLEVPFSEGVFFPDTYRFQKGETDRRLLLRAHAGLEAILEDVWVERSPGPINDPWELLILASIIEKETGDAGDRAVISQVFHNRLHRGMRLQSDPTVIYGIGPDFDGNITRAHLKTDTDFNTYTRHGLPPTPIALVSEASLRAAAEPEPGPYLYFVSRGDGTSQFSTTLAEHNAAVRKYQLK